LEAKRQVSQKYTGTLITLIHY